MIELDVQPRRKPSVSASGNVSRYLVLGDFGGNPAGSPVVDRDNLDQVFASQDVKLAGAQLREIAPAPTPPSQPQASPRPDLEKILQRSSLLEQIAGGGDPFEQYVSELARAHAAPLTASNPQRIASLGERMRALL